MSSQDVALTKNARFDVRVGLALQWQAIVHIILGVANEPDFATDELLNFVASCQLLGGEVAHKILSFAGDGELQSRFTRNRWLRMQRNVSRGQISNAFVRDAIEKASVDSRNAIVLSRNLSGGREADAAQIAAPMRSGVK